MAEREIAEVIGANVRRLRVARGWNQRELAQRVRAQGLRSWSPASIAVIENQGQRADRIVDVLALCLAFRVDMEELLAATDTVTAVDTGGPEPVELSRLQSFTRGMLPDEEGEESTFYSEEDDPYDVARIARSLDVDPHLFRLVVYAVFGRYSFIEVRDERAGVNVRPGSRASIQRRRGAATRAMVAEIREAAELAGGTNALVGRAADMLRAAAINMEET